MINRLQSSLGSVPQALVSRIAREFIEETGFSVQSTHPGFANKLADVSKKDKKQVSKSSLQSVQDIEPCQLSGTARF